MKDIVIDGIDRLGKDSLISNIQHKLGFFQEIHYQKPKRLNCYCDALEIHSPLQKYQVESFFHMFRLLSQPGRHIMNRSHLGEAVYSHRYRTYDGNYVFDLENRFINDFGSSLDKTTLLILLTTSDFSFIKDDGLSFDFNKKEEEQADFIKAFNRSRIKNKVLIDVSNGSGGYRPYDDIVAQVIDVWAPRHEL